MKVIQVKPYFQILLITFTIIIFSSCSSQSQPNQAPEKVQLSTKHSPSTKSQTDTTLHLNFPSGIRSILEDSKGNIWFGSHQNGVCRFDGKKLTYFTEKDGLSNNQVRSIYEDSNGKIWFECGKGLSSFDGKTLTTHTIKNLLSKNNWQSGENDLWFKGDEEAGYNDLEGNFGVYRYDGKTLSYHLFPITARQGDRWSYSVSTPFQRGKNGMVWFGTYSAVIGYNGTFPIAREAAFTIIDDKSLGFIDLGNDDTGRLHVRSILEDSKGNLWIGNNGIGVLLYNGKTTINFSKLQGLISENSKHSGGYRSPPGSLEHVFSIGEDRDGNIWFGDRDTGAWRYDGKSMKNFTEKDGISTPHIWQIYSAHNGELWFAMGDGKVLKFNGKSFDRIF